MPKAEKETQRPKQDTRPAPVRTQAQQERTEADRAEADRTEAALRVSNIHG